MSAEELPQIDAFPMRCPHRPGCGIELASPAEWFLHKLIHDEPREPANSNLRNLPFALAPRVAEVMEAFARALLRATLRDIETMLDETRPLRVARPPAEGASKP